MKKSYLGRTRKIPKPAFKLGLSLSLVLARAAVAAADVARGDVRPLKDVRFFGGVAGLTADFRTVFDNTEYSVVRLPKPDERTYFFSDLTAYLNFYPVAGLITAIGGKVTYDFGADAPGAGGPKAYARFKATWDTEHHHWTFGHFREGVTPLTFVMRDYDDDLAGLRYRFNYGVNDTRLFLARTSTVGEERPEVFGFGGRTAFVLWEKTTLAGNIAGIHEGGFDAGIGSPPPGRRNRRVELGTITAEQLLPWGFFLTGEAAVSLNHVDAAAMRDNAYWVGAGWRRVPYAEVAARVYRVGWAFETPWGERFLRNEERRLILDDFVACGGYASLTVPIGEVARATFAFDGGVKFLTTTPDEQDFNFVIQLIKFEAWL